MVPRVLFIDNVSCLAGAELSLRDLIEDLDALRFQPFVVTFEHGPLVEYLCNKGINVRVITLNKNVQNFPLAASLMGFLSMIPRLYDAMVTVAELVKWIRTSRIDIVITWSNKAAIIGGLAARLSRRQQVHYLQEVITPETHSWVTRKILIASMKHLCRHVICNSKATKHAYVREGGYLSQSSIVYPGMKQQNWNVFNTLSARTALGINPDGFVIGTACRLAPIKGLDYLISAVSLIRDEYPDIVLLIAGEPIAPLDYKYLAILKRQVEGLNLQKNVQFIGFKSDITQFFAALDVFVLASHSEGFGRVIAEAMFASKPVVATRTGALPELVEDGETGILVNPAQAGDLAIALLSLIRSPTNRLRMGRAGRARALAQFTILGHIQQFQAILSRFM